MLKKALLTSFAALLISAPANATLINFDDLTLGNSTEGKIPDGYAGLAWNQFGFRDATGDWANGVVSSPKVAFNMGGFLPSIYASETPAFTFNGASFTSVYKDSLTILVHAYTTDGEQYGVVTAKTTPEYSSFNWTGVSIVNFWPIASIPDTYFAMDNLRINEPVGEVPLPAALPLFGTGLLALAAKARKRKAA